LTGGAIHTPDRHQHAPVIAGDGSPRLRNDGAGGAGFFVVISSFRAAAVEQGE
jgi:hypothetical protein